MKRAKIGCARAAEQVFKTLELMPAGPVAEFASKTYGLLLLISEFPLFLSLVHSFPC